LATKLGYFKASCWGSR